MDTYLVEVSPPHREEAGSARQRGPRPWVRSPRRCGRGDQAELLEH
jgi:hypothetical protein